MSSITEGKLASLAAGQWGMVTAAQASADGVARSTLLRRERTGVLDRVRSGVYRTPGAPPNRLDDIRSAWLATDPLTPAWMRLDPPIVVVGGAAAAWVHEIGDLYPSPYLLYTELRRQTNHDDIRYSIRHILREDVAIVDGLPVTSRERTIADLLDEPGSDLSIVAGALRDAERAGIGLDDVQLVRHLGPHARRLGFTNGALLYQRLRELSRVDEERLQEFLTDPNLAGRIDALVEERVRVALDRDSLRISSREQA